MKDIMDLHTHPIDSDAHVEGDAGNHEQALALLEEIGFPGELVVNASLDKLVSFIPRAAEAVK